MPRRPITHLAGLLAALLAVPLLTASHTRLHQVLTFSDPALDANGINTQGEKCCGSVDVPTDETTSDADADILDVELSPTTRDGVRTGWKMTVTLTGELGNDVNFTLDGHTRRCDNVVLSYRPATLLSDASTGFGTVCGDGERATWTDLEPPVVEGNTFTIAVPDAAMSDSIDVGEILTFIWLEARGNAVRGVIDSADADRDDGFVLRTAPVPAPTESPRPDASASPEPSETASPEPSETASPEPSESASPTPSESASPEPEPDDSASPEPEDSDPPEDDRDPPGSEPRASAGDVTRVQGDNRSATAAAVAEEAFPQRADTVVVASAADYPDALAGAPLAGLHRSPVLLSSSDRLGDDALRQVRRLQPRRAVVLGGTAALSDQVATDLEQAGVSQVERVAGQDRFATAAEAAGRVALHAGAETVYVVEGGNADPGRGWPDAVAASSSAALQRRPVLLVTTDDLPDATREFMSEHDVQRVIVVGGSAAVSDAVERELAGLVPQVERLAGADRFATSRRVADDAVRQGADAGTTWFATGANWPDALAAGPAAAAQGGVLLLSPTGDSGPARSWVEASGRCLDATFVGGEAAISARVEGEVRDTVECRTG